jgi:hypothetical protein
MPVVGFETAIPASERPQNHPLERAATGTGFTRLQANINWPKFRLIGAMLNQTPDPTKIKFVVKKLH